MNDDALARQKQTLRKLMRQRRHEAAAHNPSAAGAVRDVFLRSIPLPAGACVGLTIAQGHELDPMPLGLALLGKGHPLCLPVVEGPQRPLAFRMWVPGDGLKPGPLGIPEPLAEAVLAQPTVILVPLLAFDRQGYRLGQGGGYYDRTLLALRGRSKILAIGLGFAAQEVDAVPRAEHDAPLDAVVTEKTVLWLSSIAP